MIKPYFSCCSAIWGNTYQPYLQKLTLSQNKTMRIVNKAEYLAHTQSLLKRNHILTFSNLQNYSVAVLILSLKSTAVFVAPFFFKY